MILTDLITQDPITGRAQAFHPAYPVAIILPNNVSDWHTMGRVRKMIVGGTTPGMTWSDGCWLNMPVLSATSPRSAVKTVVHEMAHWWEMWRLMGTGNWRATYGWHGLLRLVTHGPKHIHGVHMQENFAREVTDRVMALCDHALRVQQPARFDTLPWLTHHYPNTR